VDRIRGGIGFSPNDPANKTSSLWDTINYAASRIKTAETTIPQSIISVSSQGNTSKTGNGAVASSELVAIGVAFYSVVGTSQSINRLDSIAATTGGFSASSASAEKPADALAFFTDLIYNKQYSVSTQSTATPPEIVEIQIATTTAKTKGVVAAGSVAIGTASTQVKMIESSGGTFFGSPIFLIFGIAILAIGVVGGTYFLANKFFARRSFSDQIESYLRVEEQEEEVTEVERNRLIKNVLVQKASEAADRMTERRGWKEKIETSLERSDISLKAGEYITIYFVSITGAFLLGLISRSPLFLLGLPVLAALAPAAYVSRKAERRKKKFTEQLPDTLMLMGSSMKAGYSLMQAVEAASQEMASPMGQELARVVNEIRLGASVPEAFDRLALRMDSEDLSWVSMGISIQRDVGGDLSQLLESIANTMLARNRLRREIATLTAEGRISAYVLTALPVVVLLAVQVLNPEYTRVLFVTWIGRFLLLFGFIMTILGLLWMQKIVKIKI
jgi:tight adherence protein B